MCKLSFPCCSRIARQYLSLLPKFISSNFGPGVPSGSKTRQNHAVWTIAAVDFVFDPRSGRRLAEFGVVSSEVWTPTYLEEVWVNAIRVGTDTALRIYLLKNLSVDLEGWVGHKIHSHVPGLFHGYGCLEYVVASLTPLSVEMMYLTWNWVRFQSWCFMDFGGGEGGHFIFFVSWQRWRSAQ